MPIAFQSSAGEVFEFPYKSFFNDKLPDIYAESAIKYRDANVSPTDMKFALQNMFSKIAVTFVETESGKAQRAAIRSIADRLKAPGAKNANHATQRS